MLEEQLRKASRGDRIESLLTDILTAYGGLHELLKVETDSSGTASPQKCACPTHRV